jgi:glycogen phosphorylase
MPGDPDDADVTLEQGFLRRALEDDREALCALASMNHAGVYAIARDHFSPHEPGVLAPLRETLLATDYYMHLADLASYLEADRKLCDLYADPDAWARKAILNVAGSGKFSSDRSIAEYAADIWQVEPCPVP